MNSLLRRIRRLPLKAFYVFLIRKNRTLLTLGDECKWTFCPTSLDSNSVVYSGGVGRDITFEHALVKRFGCRVFLFDPSPPGEATMKLPENQIPEFVFAPVGLAGAPCTIQLSPPRDGDILRSSWMFTGMKAEGSLEVQCLDLLTLMMRNGHREIDLLKIDIEGAEYGVLEQILRDRIAVRQLLVEFHHGIIPGIFGTSSMRSILKLISQGYHLIDVDGNNHTFVHKSF